MLKFLKKRRFSANISLNVNVETKQTLFLFSSLKLIIPKERQTDLIPFCCLLSLIKTSDDRLTMY